MPHQGFAIYAHLMRKGHSSTQMGLKGTDGDVARWNARVKLARNFRGVLIDSCSERTLKGYNAFFQAFLTHSALERYLSIVDLKGDQIAPILEPHDPERVVKEFFAHDKNGKLFEFLHRWANPRLRDNLTACREGNCTNVFHISASIRHIFSHGHMAANSNGMNPAHVASACGVISEFLLEFMEYNFTSRISEYKQSLKAKS